MSCADGGSFLAEPAQERTKETRLSFDLHAKSSQPKNLICSGRLHIMKSVVSAIPFGTGLC